MTDDLTKKHSVRCVVFDSVAATTFNALNVWSQFIESECFFYSIANDITSRYTNSNTDNR